MNKRLLAVFASIIQIVSAFLLFVDGMIVWYCFTLYDNISNKSHSMSWLLDSQVDKGALLYLMLALILANIAVNVVTIFKDVPLFQKKYMLALPVVTLATFIIIGVWCDSLADSFTYYGELRFTAVGLGILFYVEAALLAVSTLIESAKHFIKMPYSSIS